MSRILFLAAALSAFASSALAASRGQIGGCGAPQYRIAWDYSGRSEVTAIVVSVDPRAVTVKKLLALACQFRADYPNSPVISADVFNDWIAARRTTNLHSIEGVAPKGADKDTYVAYYHLDRAQGIETLTLVVDAEHPCSKDIEIDLKRMSVGFVSCK